MHSRNADLRAVASAYLQSCKSGQGDRDAFELALNIYKSRHTGMPDDEANVRVRRLIAEATERFGLWEFRTSTSSYIEDDE